MKAIRLRLYMTLFSAVVSCGCRAERAKPSANGLVVFDDVGRRISLSKPAERIVSLSPANTEILFALGCGSKVLLRDKASDMPEAVKKLPATDPFVLAVGHIAGFRPQLVLLGGGQSNRVAAFEALGLSVAQFDPKTVDQLLVGMQKIARLCGAEKRGATLVAQLQQRIDRVARHVLADEPVRVYVEVDGSNPLKPWTVGPGSFVYHLLELAGGVSAVANLKRAYVQINFEAVLASQPDAILITYTRDKLAGKPGPAARIGWQHLKAVKLGRVIDHIDPDLLVRPGPRIVDGLEQLARALHVKDPQR